MTEITGFSDSSWQDFPDTGRSTIGYKIFLNGGLVEWGTSVPIPIAMSSAEAEYMAACTACMSMAHIKMLIYDIKNLSSKNYNPNEQSLATMNILLVYNESKLDQRF